MRYPFGLNKQKYINIVKMILSKFPKISTSKSFQWALDNENYELRDIIKEHLQESKEDVCYICLSYEPSCEILHNVCSCKSLCHAFCLIKFLDRDSICKVCNALYRTNQKRFKLTNFGETITPDPIVYFPYDDMYYMPSLSKQVLFKAEGLNTIIFPIVFLQTKRLKQLLSEKTYEESKMIYENPSFKRVCQTTEDLVDSNYSKEENPEAYNKIQHIINNWCTKYQFESFSFLSDES